MGGLTLPQAPPHFEPCSQYLQKSEVVQMIQVSKLTKPCPQDFEAYRSLKECDCFIALYFYSYRQYLGGKSQN